MSPIGKQDELKLVKHLKRIQKYGLFLRCALNSSIYLIDSLKENRKQTMTGLIHF